MQDLIFVADQSRNMYSERTFARLSKYYFDRKEYGNAITYYSKLLQNSDSRWNVLDANQGLMRSYFALNQLADARIYAQSVSSYEHSSETAIWEAKLILARIQLAENELSDALVAFTSIYEQTKSEPGAAAKYFIADIQFRRNEFVPSQNTIFELIDKIPYYDEWIGRAFLLLAETYVALEEDFQAIATLQSIVDNRPVDAISNQARARLAELQARQVKKRSPNIAPNNSTQPDGGGEGANEPEGSGTQNGGEDNEPKEGDANHD